MNKAYDAALVTTGVVGLSMASKKLLGEELTDTTKLAVGVTASTMLVKWAQDKKYLPVDPFKM